MPVQLRQRLICHYCGKRNKSARKHGDRFKCEYCLADNFLDENGEIADVPPEEAASFNVNNLYPDPPGAVSSQSSIFCSTCTKNQYLYTTNLSEYLPDPDDPNYELCEAALPEFKKQLELRYPTCCAQCEPRVRSQLHQATYAAKADNLRRVLERTHARRVANRWGWRSLLVSAAGLGYLVSLGTQLLWHGLGSQIIIRGDDVKTQWRECLFRYPVLALCAEKLDDVVEISFIFGLVCVWWNPKWQHKLQGNEGRLVGLDQFYRVQAGLFVIRFGAWVVTKDIPGIDQYRSALHTISFLLISMVTVWSLFRVIKVDTTPLVNWHQDPAPLLHRDQFVPPTAADYQSQHPLDHQTSSAFPMQSLTAPQRSNLEPWRPPTPPGEDDAMDWTPSQPDFNPRLRAPPQKQPTQPSPFYGELPNAPRRGPLHPRAPVRQVPPKQPVPPGFFGLSRRQDSSDNTVLDATSNRAVMAEPRFFANTRSADTGLESIFDKIFSVQDAEEDAKRAKIGTGHALKAPRQDTVSLGVPDASSLGQDTTERNEVSGSLTHKTRQSTTPLVGRVMSAVMVSLLIFVAMTYHVVSSFFPWLTANSLGSFRYAVSIPILHLLDEVVRFRTLISARTAFLVFEILGLGYLSLLKPEPDSEHAILWSKLMLGAICLLSMQEVYSLLVCDAEVTNQQVSLCSTPSGPNLSRPDIPQQQEHDLFDTSYTSSSTFPYHKTTDQPYTLPSVTQLPPFARRDSSESLASTSSITTTSTAPGWKTPKSAAREFDWTGSTRTTDSPYHRRQSSTPSTYGMGGLNLGQGFSTGLGVAGPRTRQGPKQDQASMGKQYR